VFDAGYTIGELQDLLWAEGMSSGNSSGRQKLDVIRDKLEEGEIDLLRLPELCPKIRGITQRGDAPHPFSSRPAQRLQLNCSRRRWQWRKIT
jgi:hypothetical protein